MELGPAVPSSVDEPSGVREIGNSLFSNRYRVQ